MALAIDSRRMGLIVLLAVLLLAVVSPACMVAAETVMAAPMSGPHDTCSPTEGPEACPHHEQMQSSAVLSQEAHVIQPAILSPAPVPELASFERICDALASPSSDEPPDKVTPLRL